MHYSVTLEHPDSFDVVQKIVPENDLVSLKDFNLVNKFPYAITFQFIEPETAANTAKATPVQPFDDIPVQQEPDERKTVIEEEEARCAFDIYQHSKEEEGTFPIKL